MFSKMIFSGFLLLASSAFAVDAIPRTSKVGFFVSESTGAGNTTYYSCDGLEDLTKSMLKKLGASDIRVRCSGGLDSGTYWGTPSIDVSFVSPMRGSGAEARAASYQTVQLRDSDNCHAAQTIFAAIRSRLDLTSVSGTESFCDSNDSYRIQAQALFFN